MINRIGTFLNNLGSAVKVKLLPISLIDVLRHVSKLAVTPHQDSTFLHTNPMKLVGFWFALEDVTLENGCLWFIPGSHKEGISRRFVRNPDKDSPNLTIYTDPNPEYDESKFVPGPVSKGRENELEILIRREVILSTFS